MHLNGWFGHLDTWLLLGSAWVGLGALVALAFGIIARVGKGKEQGKMKRGDYFEHRNWLDPMNNQTERRGGK